MLTHIHIRNYAIIDEVDLEFRSGLTVLSGETGAGKSIVVDALSLTLGDRADATCVRHGADKADITAGFDVSANATVAQWLDDKEMDAGGECIVRRVIAREGRSRAFVNGHNVPLQSLKELGDLLIDIHGQQAHQSLVRRPVQRRILDFRGGHSDEVQRVRDSFMYWRDIRADFDRLDRDQQDRDARLDLLRYQTRELEALDLEPGETAQLEGEHRKLAAAGRLIEQGQAALTLIADDDMASAQHRLSEAGARLADLTEVDDSLVEISELIASAGIQVSEAASALSTYLSGLDLDPARIDWVEERLASVQQLARKHRIEPAQLPDQLERLRQQLNELEHSESRLAELAESLAKAERKYLEAARKLHRCRIKTASDVSEKITSVMRELGMPGGKFEVAIEYKENSAPTVYGLDDIEFLVTANPGQPPMTMGRVASGGELSRIDLAVQVNSAAGTLIPSMVFDEVDQGIGGGTAEIVGRKLRELGEHRQVICVTHLPQVASQSHHHLRVTKLTDGTITRTTITELKPDERIEELARMLGGVQITARTREHAREMMARAQKLKKAGSGK